MRTLPDVNALTTSKAAATYAEADFAVFPLVPTEKRPATPNGRDDATSDPVLVSETWPSDEHGVGIFANPSNVVVFDVDDESKVPEHLLDVLAENPSAMVLTRKGRHVYYATDGTDYHSVFKKAEGYDVIANGYVVAPPTTVVNEETGELHTYEAVFHDIAPVPDEILALLSPLGEVEKGRRATSDEVAEFLATYTSENEPEALDEHLAALNDAFAVSHRNEVLIRRLPNVLRDAMRGKFPAADAVEAVRLLVGDDKGWSHRYDEKVEQAVGYVMGERFVVLEGFEPTPKDEEDFYNPTSLTDAHLGERVAREYLSGKFIAWSKSAWSRWDGRRWERTTDTTVFEATRRALMKIHAEETKAANKRLEDTLDRIRAKAYDDESTRQTDVNNAQAEHGRRMKSLGQLFTVGKIGSVVKVARGLVEVSMKEFDQHADLLNVGNGVVDLRTGDLRPHDPSLYFTKVTEVDYKPDARHDDWDKALTALPDEVGAWMQVRFGQAATAHPASDDIVPFLKGDGANGKSTIVTGVAKALGDFAVYVPEKVLLASPSDHPTELMTLHGARLAYLEELPEGDYINSQRLKKVVGTEGMTARYIGQDSVSWSPTHSLMVTTNHDVQVDAVDHGAWRRLALVEFPYTYDGRDPKRPKDATLRDRVKNDPEVHEAVLAWVVNGARRWYDNGKVIPEMPETVQADTSTWKYKANHAARFMEEFLELDPNAAVRPGDVFRLFTQWAQENGMRRWNEVTFWKRARHHDWFTSRKVEKPDGARKTVNYSVQTFGNVPKKEQERLLMGVRFNEDAVRRLHFL